MLNLDENPELIMDYLMRNVGHTAGELLVAIETACLARGDTEAIKEVLETWRLEPPLTGESNRE